MKIPPIHSWGLNLLFNLYKKMSQTQVLSTVAFYMNLLFNHAETLQYSPYQDRNHSPNSRHHTSSSERYNFPDTRTPQQKQADEFALNVLVCNYRTRIDCRRGLIDEYQARTLIDTADTIHTNVKNGNLSPEE